MTAALAIFAALATGPGALAAEEKARPWLVSISANYGAWRTSDLDSDGTQALAFAQVSYDTEKWGAAVTGSFVSTSYLASHADERIDITSATDTDISTYYTKRMGRLTLRGGVDARIPAGKSSYSEDELGKIIVDDLSSDLMLINTYGGGLNIAPHMMAVYKFGRVSGGVGIRYEFAGEYDPTTDTPDDNFDPGDTLLAVINAVARAVGDDYVLVTATYSMSGRDRQGGRDVYRQGDTLALEARYIRQWFDRFTSVAGAVYKTQRKNEIMGDGGVIESERANSNNNSAEVYASSVYRFSRGLSINGLFGYKAAGANGYAEEDEFYDAGREKAYIEPAVTWHFNSSVYTTLRARYSRVVDKEDAASGKDAVYDVFNVDAGVVYSF